MATTTLSPDIYGRTVTKDTAPDGKITYSVPGVISGPWDASEANSEARARAAFAISAPVNYVPPAEPLPAVQQFVRAIARDNTLTARTRNVVRFNLNALQAALMAGDVAGVTAGWQDLIADFNLSAADQAKVHAYALQFGIPGI